MKIMQVGEGGEQRGVAGGGFEGKNVGDGRTAMVNLVGEVRS